MSNIPNNQIFYVKNVKNEKNICFFQKNVYEIWLNDDFALYL